MAPHFTVVTFIIPCCIFIFSLYIAVVPKKLSPQANKSTKRIIFCRLGEVVGLVNSIATLIFAGRDMDQTEAHRFLLGIAILSWSVYSFYTNHSNLSKWKKITKVIIYWLITGCFLSASSYHEQTRLQMQAFNIILAIIAYYTVCEREILEKPQKKENRSKESDGKKNIIFHRICKNLRRIITPLNHIWQYCVRNKKNIVITVIVIIVLWLLPFYIEYLIKNSGIRILFKHR